MHLATLAHAIIYDRQIPQLTLAQAAGVSKVAAHKWFHLGGTPKGAKKRERIALALLEADGTSLIPSQAWDLPPSGYVFGQRPPYAAEPEGPEAPAHVSISMPPRIEVAQYKAAAVDFEAAGAARRIVEAQLLRLRQDIANHRAAQADAATIVKLETEERRAAMDLAKLAGELNPTEEQKLVKSKQWHRIRNAILRTLERHPDAYREVHSDLLGLGA